MKNSFANKTEEYSLDDIFENIFLSEINKKTNKKEIDEKSQKIYTYKYNKMLPLINFFKKIKDLDLYVRSYTDFNFYTYVYKKELIKFDFVVRDTMSKKNAPSPSIYIENPLSMEISMKNDINNITFDINIISEDHPDKMLINNQYTNIKELIIDLSTFFGKNMVKKEEE